MLMWVFPDFAFEPKEFRLVSSANEKRPCKGTGLQGPKLPRVAGHGTRSCQEHPAHLAFATPGLQKWGRMIWMQTVGPFKRFIAVHFSQICSLFHNVMFQVSHVLALVLIILKARAGHEKEELALVGFGPLKSDPESSHGFNMFQPRGSKTAFAGT